MPKAYANQIELADHLLPVPASANQKKGARDPAEWMPSNTEFHAEYARMWIAVKLEWGLLADAAELQVLQSLLGNDPKKEYPTEGPEALRQ